MGVLEDVSESGMGWPLGIGLLVAALSAGPKLVKAGKPVIKGAMRGYLILQSKSKEVFAETSERIQDLYAETKYEFEHQPEAKVVEAQEPVKAAAKGGAARAEGAKPRRRPRTRSAKPAQKSAEAQQ